MRNKLFAAFGVLVLCGATLMQGGKPQAVAQLGAPPAPIAAPPDVTPALTSISASLGYQSGVNQSHETAIQTLWPVTAQNQTDIAALQSQLANLPAGPVGPAGAIGPAGPQGSPGTPGGSLNAPAIDTSAIAASSPAASLVRTLCYPAAAYIGNVPSAGESIDFSVPVTTSGTYTLQACVASLGGAHTYHFEFPIGTKLPSVTVVNTGSYQVFAYQSAGSVQLPAGTATIRVVLENGGMNFAGFNYK